MTESILSTGRARQVCILGSAEPGSSAYALAGAAGELLARLGITVVSGCGSPATRVAAQRALDANGLVVSIVPSDDINLRDWPCTVLIPCGMGDARNLLMALAGDACLVIGGRAGTISEVCLAWLHRRPLLPLTGCGGWSDRLEKNPPDERGNSRILGWSSIADLERNLRELGLVGGAAECIHRPRRQARSMKVIRTYSMKFEADLARIALEGNDIPAVVVGVDIGIQGGIAGMQLLVPEDCIEAAQAVLKELEEQG